ncbi:LOW QUALITY PROTEIN: nephrocystin-1 [Neosynchiropus ocellatus]
MPFKRKGPLQLLQKDVDDIKRQVCRRLLSKEVYFVDNLLKEVRVKSTEETFQRCQELVVSAECTLKTLNKLTKADEPAPVGSYDQRKQEQEKRLRDICEILTNLSLELSPPGPSKTAGASSKDASEDAGGDEYDEEEEDEEDEDEEEESSVVSLVSQLPVYKVLSEFQGEQDGDLSVQKGEVLRIIRKTGDGWWLAQNPKGDKGVVPRTYLKTCSGASEEEEEEVEEEDEDDGEEEEDSEEEDDEQAEDGKSEAAASNWSTVRRALTEIDATDVLSAMGAIPSGFRPSTLNKLLLEEGVRYRASHYSQPQLSPSQLSFSDLFLDPDSGRVRARQVRTCVCFTLWGCRMIPTPGVGVQVLSRHIRLCAFDGTQVLSNVHTVRATYNPKSPKTWTFSPRVAGLLPTLLDGDCFLRCSSSSPDLGVLFELGVSFIRNVRTLAPLFHPPEACETKDGRTGWGCSGGMLLSRRTHLKCQSTGERGDLSCGWTFLKLTDDAGNPLPNRTYELQVHGGTPYERDVGMETAHARDSPASVFQHMLQSRRQAKLTVKLRSVKSPTRAQLSLLPDTLLHCLSCVPLLTLHRQLLADALLMDRPTMQTADLISSPVLSTFPLLLDQPDLLDAVRSAWLEAEARMSRAQKRDSAYLKQEFTKVYMSSAYFLLHSSSLPPYRWADPPTEEQRARVIFAALKHWQEATSQSGGPEIFADLAHQHVAFDISELSFDLLRVAR